MIGIADRRLMTLITLYRTKNLFCGLECKIYFAGWSAKFILRPDFRSKFILRLGVQNLFCGLECKN